MEELAVINRKEYVRASKCMSKIEQRNHQSFEAEYSLTMPQMPSYIGKYKVGQLSLFSLK